MYRREAGSEDLTGVIMARNDYTPAQRQAWQAQRLAAERARGLGNHSKGVDALPRVGENVFSRTSKLNQQLDKQLQKQVNQAVADKAPKGATLHAEISSECLETLDWRDGVASFNFVKRNKNGPYQVPMSKSEFVDWVSSDSIGSTGNDEGYFD
jgi:hypothetical protein